MNCESWHVHVKIVFLPKYLLPYLCYAVSGLEYAIVYTFQVGKSLILLVDSKCQILYHSQRKLTNITRVILLVKGVAIFTKHLTFAGVNTFSYC